MNKHLLIMIICENFNIALPNSALNDSYCCVVFFVDIFLIKADSFVINSNNFSIKIEWFMPICNKLSSSSLA